MASKHLRLLSAGLAVGAVALVAAGCGDDDGTDSASGSAAAECEPVGDIAQADTTVNVTLDEWVIGVAEPNAPAGSIGFAAENIGDEPHELVVVSGVSPTDLPLDDDGALDEAQLPDGALIGEIEGFPSGETCDGVFDLDPGEYTLVCNITETEPNGEVESHLAEGMLTTFTVR